MGEVSAYYAPVLRSENWQSISLYEDNYHEYLEKWFPERLVQRVGLVEPKEVGKWKRRYLRDVLYPLTVRRMARKTEGVPLHVFDHSYGHLVRHWSPTILHCRDLNHTVLPSLKGLQLMRWKQRVSGLRKAERVIAISDQLRGELLKHVGVEERRIRRIYHGVDLKRFSPERRDEAERRFPEITRLAKEEFLVLNVGTNLPRKNLGTVYRAVSSLRKQGVPARLLRVGNDDIYPGEEEQRKQCGVEGCTMVMGSLSSDDVALLMTLCNTMSFASLYEGFGRPILEAQAAGLPLVAAEASCVPEIAGDGAWYHEGEDAQKLANLLGKVSGGGVEVDALRKRGLRNAERFSWRQHLEEVLAVYDEFG